MSKSKKKEKTELVMRELPILECEVGGKLKLDKGAAVYLMNAETPLDATMVKVSVKFIDIGVGGSRELRTVDTRIQSVKITAMIPAAEGEKKE